MYLIIHWNICRGEGALCVAAGDHWAAVATTKHRIRLFSSAGLQQSILCLSGPVVTMVGSGPLLAIVHHASNPFAHTQNLIYSVMDIAQVLQHTDTVYHVNASHNFRIVTISLPSTTYLLEDYGGKRATGTYTRVKSDLARF